MRVHAPCMLAALLCLSGCYTYVRPIGDPPVGSEVQVTLTDAGIKDAAPHLGPNISSLTGNVTGVEADQLRVAMRSITKRNGVDEYWTGEHYAMRRDHIATLGVRRLSWWRTAVLAGVAGGVSFIVAKGISDNLDSSGGGGPRPPSQ